MISCPKKQMIKYRIANISKEATALLNRTNYGKAKRDVPPSAFLKAILLQVCGTDNGKPHFYTVPSCYTHD